MGADVVIAVGGEGTVRTVASALWLTPLTLLVLFLLAQAICAHMGIPRQY